MTGAPGSRSMGGRILVGSSANESPEAGPVGALARRILAAADGRPRTVVAIAGPPAAGKSTLAALLAEAIETRGASAAVLPMDGFHFDDAILSERGLASRKGSPPTFDAAGLEVALRRVRDREPDVAVPVFDRSMELARAAARVITAETAVVIVEGNYLLLDEPPWRRLRDLFDVTVLLEESMGELERRLAARWAHHGREADAARQWIRTNDLPNARVVLERSGEPDIRVVGGRLAG